jgi:DNA polymerase
MKINTCQKCDLCINNNFIPIPNINNVTAPIHIILETPKHKEVKLQQSCISRANKLLLNYLKEYTLHDMCYITHSVKCKTTFNKKPTKEELQKCRSYIIAELILGKPKVIILIGSTAINSYYNTYRNLKLYNKIKNINNTLVFHLYNTNYYLKNKNERKDYDKVFKLLKELKYTKLFY